MVRTMSVLPVRSDLSHRMVPAPESPGFIESQAPHRRPRLLIVEDDRDVRESLASLLGDFGFELFEAADGLTGLARAERDAPDLVLLDLMLPRNSGIIVLDQIKSRRIRRIPVIMMSGSQEQRHQELAFAHGADRYLLKPFDATDILVLAHQLLPGLFRVQRL